MASLYSKQLKYEIMIYLAPLLFIISGLPQTIKLITTKTSFDISLWTYILTWIAIFLILTEASGSVWIANFASIFITTINILLIIYYRQNNLRNNQMQLVK
jgi:uncharacterized protein with PQ loop repeat